MVIIILGSWCADVVLTSGACCPRTSKGKEQTKRMMKDRIDFLIKWLKVLVKI